MKRFLPESTENAQLRRRLDHGIIYPVRRRADSREAVQTDMASGSVISTDQAMQDQGRSDSQPPIRRRCQVACWRCRKRKIRCSGDTGNGQACANCKNSGTSDCFFTRVNSSLLQPGSSWSPYAALKSVASPDSENRRGNYEPQQYAGTTPFPLNSTPQLPSTSAPSPASQADFDYGTNPPLSSYHRSSYSSVSSLGYDENPVAYSVQVPSYLLPSSDSGAVPGSYSISSNLRDWPSSSQPLKTTNGAIYSDTDAQSSLGSTSSFAFPSHAFSQATSFAENPTAFTVGAALHPSLTGTVDRTLPNPAASRNTLYAPFVSDADTLTNTSASAVQSHGSRRPHTLGIDPLPSGNDRYSGPKTITTGETMKAAVVSTSQDIGFGYITVPKSSPVTTMDVTNGFQASDSGIDKARREDLLYSPNLCSSAAYVYSTATNGGVPCDSEPPATLTSGHEYTQLIEPTSRQVIIGSGAENMHTLRTNANAVSSHTGRSGF